MDRHGLYWGRLSGNIVHYIMLTRIERQNPSPTKDKRKTPRDADDTLCLPCPSWPTTLKPETFCRQSVLGRCTRSVTEDRHRLRSRKNDHQRIPSTLRALYQPMAPDQCTPKDFGRLMFRQRTVESTWLYHFMLDNCSSHHPMEERRGGKRSSLCCVSARRRWMGVCGMRSDRKERREHFRSQGRKGLIQGPA